MHRKNRYSFVRLKMNKLLKFIKQLSIFNQIIYFTLSSVILNGGRYNITKYYVNYSEEYKMKI